jgi:hypothetical protein
MAIYKKQLIAHLAARLHSFGYQVYIAESKEYGFYTDGSRVVSFGGTWEFMVDFTGNYRAKTDAGARTMGTGWGIAKELSDITEEQAHRFVTSSAPTWATGGHPYTLVTPEEHLKTYDKSSHYTLYTGPVQWVAHATATRGGRDVTIWTRDDDGKALYQVGEVCPTWESGGYYDLSELLRLRGLDLKK